jgi:hypothetical protein
MKAMMRTPPVSVIFADDDDFTAMFLEDFLPSVPVRSLAPAIQPSASHPIPSTSLAGMGGWGGDAPRERTQSNGPCVPTSQKSEVIDLLDDE